MKKHLLPMPYKPELGVTIIDPPIPPAPSTAVVPNDRVERMASLRELVASIYRQNQEIRELVLYNFNQGMRLDAMPGGHPLDYKLNQLDHFVTQLRDIIDPEREVERKEKWLEKQRKLKR